MEINVFPNWIAFELFYMWKSICFYMETNLLMPSETSRVAVSFLQIICETPRIAVIFAKLLMKHQDCSFIFTNHYSSLN